MYERTFHKAHQTRRFLITTLQSNGWEVRDEQDAEVLRLVHVTDWHRVERARMAFAELAMRLENAGWVES